MGPNQGLGSGNKSHSGYNCEAPFGWGQQMQGQAGVAVEFWLKHGFYILCLGNVGSGLWLVGKLASWLEMVRINFF